MAISLTPGFSLYLLTEYIKRIDPHPRALELALRLPVASIVIVWRRTEAADRIRGDADPRGDAYSSMSFSAPVT
jgi:hypothetical protein